MPVIVVCYKLCCWKLWCSLWCWKCCIFVRYALTVQQHYKIFTIW